MRLGFMMALLVTAWAPPLAAADLFVDGASASCSDAATHAVAQNEATPTCGMQAAADLANPGDVVRVKSGTYTQTAFLDIERGGTAADPVTFQPYGDGPVSIVGPSNDRAVGIYVDYVVFEGFEIRDCGETGLRNGGSYVTLRGNWIHDCGRGCSSSTKCGQGVGSNSSNSVGVVIENNVSYRNGSGFSLDHCYYISGQQVVVRNNVAWDCAGWGFQIYPDCDDCDVYNNLSYGNANQSGFVLGGEQGSNSLSSNMRVYNNIAMANGKLGFLIYENGAGGIELVNNIAFGNPNGAVDHTDPTIMYTVSGMIEADPLLVDPAGMDWHIMEGSPAIDAGSDVLVPPFDIDGQSRPMGGVVDIGVDEFGDDPGSGSAVASGAAVGSGGNGSGPGGAGGGSADAAGDDGGCACTLAGPRSNWHALAYAALLWACIRRRKK